MKFLLSGEGPTDIGTESPTGEFLHGPMTLFIDKLATPLLKYSPRETEGKPGDILEFCSKQKLTGAKKPTIVKLTGKRYGKGRAYFTANAQVLGALANQRMLHEKCPYIAVLFRDGDGSNSKDEWQEKWDSIKRGFLLENYTYGVPMVPRPKSEAWLLQAHISNTSSTKTYENRTGNKTSSSNVKEMLETLLKTHPSRQVLVDFIEDGIIDPQIISKACVSFQAFRKALENALQVALRIR